MLIKLLFNQSLNIVIFKQSSTHRLFKNHYIYPKLISLLIFLSGIGWCSPMAVQSKNSSFYGLGIKPQFSQIRTRCGDLNNLIAVNLLAPDDGGRTLTARPTFYWYIEHKSGKNNYSKTRPKPKEFNVDFILRDGFDRKAQPIFKVRSRALQVNQKGSLYKLTLPSNAPLIDVGKIYSWQIRYTDGNISSPGSQIDERKTIKRENNQSVIEQVNSASTDLLKARIYADNAYWYDALDAYSKWIDENPSDQQALTERMRMFNEIIDRQQKLKCAVKFNAVDMRLNKMQSTPLNLADK
ncbi:MAG: hypothetical protein DCE90_08090 [Pseudanabaena sp.]|nr:MAG: hypothetical protein DCE90_08090 [Pseudanabaena sp.]